MDQQLPLSEEEERLLAIKNQQLIESALYLAGRPVQIEELSEVTNVDTSEIGSIIRDLQEKYKQFFSAFQIVELPGRKYVFQVKPEVADSVKDITLQPLLSIGELRTLAMIAYQQPVLQSTVVKVRGQQAYAHIKRLIRSGFVKSKPHQQTLELRTTNMFSDYFGLSKDPGVLKRQLGWRTKRIIKKKKMEQRDSESIEDFMEKLGLDDKKAKEQKEDLENATKVDKDSAKDVFTTMLDQLEDVDPFEEEEIEEED